MPSVVAEFSVTPMVAGEWKPYVDTAVGEIERAGLKHMVGPEAATVEGDLETVLDAIKHAHQAVQNRGVSRVITDIRIDEKQGGLSMDEEVKGYR
jgi:uncharacterized protein YqgV (UPF0045/DUF77 family)